MRTIKVVCLVLVGFILGVILGYFIIWHNFPFEINGEEFGSWAEWISGGVGAAGILVSLYIAFSKDDINVINVLTHEESNVYKLKILNASPSIIELFPVVEKSVSILVPENGIYRFESINKKEIDERTHEIKLEFTGRYFAKLVFLNIVAGQKVTIRMRKTLHGQWKLWGMKILDK